MFLPMDNLAVRLVTGLTNTIAKHGISQMNRELSSNERSLALSILPWLAHEMSWRSQHMSPAPTLLHAGGQSNFEKGFSALTRAGLMRNEGIYGLLTWEAGQSIELPTDYRRDDLDELLEAFACHSHYADEFADHYVPVVPKNNSTTRICEAFCACGYMERTRRGWAWTDSFGPWLVYEHCWRLSEYEAADDESIAAALENLPVQTLETLKGKTCSFEPDFLRILFVQYRNGVWSEDNEWRTVPSDGWDMNLAAGLYERLQKPGYI